MDSLTLRQKRDATKIVELSTEALEDLHKTGMNLVPILTEIQKIAKRMDARTGRMDPSARPKKKKKLIPV